MSKQYLLEPEYKKSSYDEEIYFKDIDGKHVRIIVICYYRWSEFEISLDEKEKEEILLKEEIILSDYDIEFISSTDCIKRNVEIQDEQKYTKEFISKIYEDIYGPEYDNSDDDSFSGNLNELEENGWTPSEVIYGLTCKCVLTEM